jgi:hypothetical protein
VVVGVELQAGDGFLLDVLANDQPACVIGVSQRGGEDLMMKATRGLCLLRLGLARVVFGRK